MSEWVRAAPGMGGAIDAMQLGTNVWVYFDNDGKITGYTSLGYQMNTFPDGSCARVFVVPYFGISGECRGNKGTRIEDRLGWKVFKGLNFESPGNGKKTSLP